MTKSKTLVTPDYVFQASWEVCNKVGGIYTVLSTHAKTLNEQLNDKLIYIGPDVWKDKENPLFSESNNLFADWKNHATKSESLQIRIGRWNIPGNPMAILVDFVPFYTQKNEIYTELWNQYKVDSLHAYGDYDEASMFAYAAGRVVESFYKYNIKKTEKVVFHAHEWMTGLAALYIKSKLPQIATVFTTHATSIGRSIASNNKPLYDYFTGYNGDQMAVELNMQSKHSIEKTTAHEVDCFTTVSKITNRECKQLLEKEADEILMNGFENGFVPKASAYTYRRNRARLNLLRLASCLTGEEFDNSALLIGTSGRYEFKNKGLDIFIDSLRRLNNDGRLNKPVLAFIEVPAWVNMPREDVQRRIQEKSKKYSTPLEQPYITHWLNNMNEDVILNKLKEIGLENKPEDKVKVIFVPCYLDGNDGILNLPYYDLILGLDLTVYPSYYEPWGYTPLESMAFHVPTITTDLAGFGLWVKEQEKYHGIKDGVVVLHRTDSNYIEVAEEIKNTVIDFTNCSDGEIKAIRRRAANFSEKALWSTFIKAYNKAYDVALKHAATRKA
ncbi:MAG: glycogen/starch synthase [Bacteroidales bacterium]|nr:glycogen/starch synthase [Bacteroidales bacterium]